MVELEQKRYADDITLQELVRLRVENERLREALNNILAVKFYGEEGGYLESDSMRDIARAALNGDE
jgi:hypothetical protein